MMAGCQQVRYVSVFVCLLKIDAWLSIQNLGDCDLNGTVSHKFMITKFQMKYQKMIYKQHNSFVTMALRFWRLTSFLNRWIVHQEDEKKKNFEGNFFKKKRRNEELGEKNVQSEERKPRKKEFALLMLWHLKCAKCACFFTIDKNKHEMTKNNGECQHSHCRSCKVVIFVQFNWRLLNLIYSLLLSSSPLYLILYHTGFRLLLNVLDVGFIEKTKI